MLRVKLLILGVGNLRRAHEERMCDRSLPHLRFIPISTAILLRAPGILEGPLSLRLPHLEAACGDGGEGEADGVGLRFGSVRERVHRVEQS